SSHLSPGSRRTTNSPHRNAMSPTSIYNRDLGTATPGTATTTNDNNLNFNQPRSIMGGGGSKTPEPVSRRSELSIDISSSSSRQVDNVTSPASARFAATSTLKRPEVLGHSKTPEMSHKREVTFIWGKGQVVTDGFLCVPLWQTTIPCCSVLAHTFTQKDAASRSLEVCLPVPAHGRFTRQIIRSEVSLSHSNMSESTKPHHPNPQGKGEKTHGSDFSYVGIDAILEQMRRKAMKQGFELNVMVVGQSGLGKSTLMNTLFKSKVSRKSVQPNPEERIPKTIEIKSISHDIEEKGVRMKLTVIDTPGFGDQINNENCWQPIMKFINDQYEAYLQEEIHINRKKRIPDSRVHCCIYFIPPTGHCLRPLDVEFMRRLSKVVNIVPVIAKADTLTLEERDDFKQTIREELRANGIDVYPQKEFDEDADDRMINDKIREMIPFAVVGSDQEYQVNGKRILGRKTKWGTIEVENIAHCEFAYLRDLLIRTHMQNIKDITGSIHYETYRVRRLNESNGHFSPHPSDHPAAQPKANGQHEEQPGGAAQPNGVAAQHEARSHEM
uniref:Septin 9 n=1 Tax=Cyclopterus lumpus TaxID=8103 RepID=A0A8C2X871_CYCLU